jgi:tetratricopeptide (TPR) repeat protein
MSETTQSKTASFSKTASKQAKPDAGTVVAKKNANALSIHEHNQRGAELLALSDFKSALASFNDAIAINANNLEAYIGAGRALTALKNYDYAIAHLQYAVGLKPDDAAAHHFLAVALQKARQFDAAILSYQRSIELKPEDVASYLNLANTLAEADRHQDALDIYDGVIAHKPDDAMAYNNRGNLYLDCKYVDEALADYDKALAIAPNEMKFIWNKALLKLLMGDFETGWQLYEYGFKTEGFARGVRKQCAQPAWLGDFSIEGKRIVLYAEQGYGDVMQFVRYAPMVAALGAEVILEVPRPLVKLIETMKGGLKVIAQGEAFTDFDAHCPLMSLPLLFKTTLGTVPTDVPYLFASQAKIANYAFADKQKLQIGLVWSGSTTHNNDHRRSIPLAALQPLLDLPVSFHNLQKEIRANDQVVLNQLPKIKSYTERLQDFTDTAALISQLDLVITVDTSVAHLAGAMGKTVWILLPYVPDYRWLLDTEISPWYPTARLFRQPSVGDWQAVVGELLTALQALINQTSSKNAP